MTEKEGMSLRGLFYGFLFSIPIWAFIYFLFTGMRYWF